MNQSRLFVLLLCIFLMTNSFSTLAQSDITFKSVKFKFELKNNLYESNQITIMIDDSQTGSNIPELPFGFNYVLSFDDKLRYNFTSALNNEFLFSSDSNLINIGRNITLYLSTPNELFKLGTREVSNVIWIHMKHIYFQWTIGDNVAPDGRGFGQGVIADSLILDSLINSTVSSENDLKILAEDVFNILFATTADLNTDNNVKTLSDQYGFFNYSIGMRDHIFNAGDGDIDNTYGIEAQASLIISAFSEVIGNLNLTTALSEFASSDTMFGNTYNSVMQITENVTSANLVSYEQQLKANVSSLTTFLSQTYHSFRDFVFNFDIEISELIIDIGNTSTVISSSTQTRSSESDINDTPMQISVYILSIFFVTLFISKSKLTQKKL